MFTSVRQAFQPDTEEVRLESLTYSAILRRIRRVKFAQFNRGTRIRVQIRLDAAWPF